MNTRYDVFDIAGNVIDEEDVLYLEFGVAHGTSLQYWTKLLRNANSKLRGFDTFEGLPSAWIRGREKGHFSTEGVPPRIEDNRVQFEIGLFEDTLPAFDWPSYERLVIVMDADLYSSTSFVLRILADRIQLGTLIYFDEFNHRCDELRAFEEFLRETEMVFRMIAGSRDLSHVLFERTG